MSKAARALLEDPFTKPIFGVASLWEIVIKSGLRRPDFTLDARNLRRNLIENGFTEMSVSAHHIFALNELPGLHRDRFDRLLIAQARAEGIMLATADEQVAAYPGVILRV